VTRSLWATVPFWLAFLLPLIVIISVYNRGWFAALPIVVIFGFLPLLDWLSGIAPIPREAPDLAFNTWFRVVTWLWVPAQIALIVWLVSAVPTAHLTPLEIFAATLSVGSATGVGMTFAHELIHRRKPFEQRLGDILLASVTYPHFAIEHVKGHHRHVGTPRDPATARLGEAIYTFIPRSIVGGLSSAWDIERQRLKEHHLGVWSLQNAMLRYACVEIAIYAVIAAALGSVAVATFAGQSLAAIAILDIGRMNNGVEQQAYCVDKNVPLLALDLLARIVPVRINARPPFSALFTLWLSMMAAVGLACRCSRSRHCS